ncbi:hypothetical protein RND81_08G216600 [Saponaria officinalis]|uniref:Uncharacterized protein n=1 Tax=Saponaria officinalis TaxID=3572 RepID=A0AAW1JCF6_SAPOF
MIQNDDAHLKLFTNTTATAATTKPPLVDRCRVTNATVLTSSVLFTVSILYFAAFYSPHPTAHFFSLYYTTRPHFPCPNPTQPNHPSPDPNLARPDPNSTRPGPSSPDPGPTRPDHIMFCLSGSAATWPDRRRYSHLWWTQQRRGHVWLDQDPPPTPGPALGPGHRVSLGPGANPSDRMARVLKESYDLGVPGVRWYVMGDDDTVFFPENLAAVLSKYDHRETYYVGGISESVEQVELHGYGTAFGGGGFAVSSGLASELVRILDGCIQRYHMFYGSDEKIAACVTELGVTLTHEPGFHQFDIRGDPYGILAAHPVAPLVSLHHLDAVKPLFPGLTQENSVKKLMNSYHIDPKLTLQQSFCYDHELNRSISVAWGYTAQLYPSLVSSRMLSRPFQTFSTWRSFKDGPFVFNTRPFGDDPCKKPVVYYVDEVRDAGGGVTLSVYKRLDDGERKCGELAYVNVTMVEKITVVATKSSPDELLKVSYPTFYYL